MSGSAPAIAAPRHGSLILAFRATECALLLPLVFALTWLEAASPRTREDLARAALCVALMVAGITGTDIIRTAFT